MKVVVGLGNPGKEYAKTRHNVGFIVIDKVADKLGIKINEKKFKGLIGIGFVNGEKVILVKPQTFMNLSGSCVYELMNYYNVDLEDLLVISDDLDLTVGSLRLKASGSSGGQKGLKDIIDKINSNDFKRLKVGIGKDKRIPTVNYVLGKLDENTAVNDAVECVIDYIKGKDIVYLKNNYNKKVKV